MNIIDKMERKFGHVGIPHLIKYVLLLSIVGNVLNLIRPGIYSYFLSFDMYQILHGQIWRLVTFLMAPSVSMGSGFIVDLIWYVIWLSLYYYVGTALEQMWGTFRFNLYYATGMVLIWIVSAASYFWYLSQLGAAKEIGFVMGTAVTTDYLNLSLFLAFAAMFPDMQFLVYFIIPVKAKWLGILDLVYLGYLTISSLLNESYLTAALIVGSLINFAIYFFFGRGSVANPKVVYKQKKRRMEYKKKASNPRSSTGAIHRCAVCGRTEQDAPELDFRYCSKCEGNYEYCSDHLFTHEHVHR